MESATPQSVGAFPLTGKGSAPPDRPPCKGIHVDALPRRVPVPDQCRLAPRNVDHRRDEGERERLRALVKGDAGPERKGLGAANGALAGTDAAERDSDLAERLRA